MIEFSQNIYVFSGVGAKQKSPNPTQSLDPAYSDLLKQQQVFLQLQILQNQQQQQQQQPQEQITVVPRYTNRLVGDTVLGILLWSYLVDLYLSSCSCRSFSGESGDLKSSGAIPQNPQPVPATTNHTPTDTNPPSKPELLPANLVDLTVRKSCLSENRDAKMA